MHDVDIPPDERVDPAGDGDSGKSRDPERTPMQWESCPGAGFTSGEPWLPIADDADEVNVAALDDDPESLLSLYRRLLEYRESEETISVGDYERVWSEGDVLAYICTNGMKRLLISLNLGDEAISMAVDDLDEGKVVLDTRHARAGERVRKSIDLAAREGVIVVLADTTDGATR